jgi:acetyl esterase/lipase
MNCLSRILPVTPKCLPGIALSLLLAGGDLWAQDLPDSVVLEKHQVEATGNAVWVYYPKTLPSEKIPCVLVAPAGSRLLDGKRVGDGDSPEHLPYVEAGFAVVSYDISGPLTEDMSDEEVVAGISAFVKSDGGISDAREAIKLAIQKFSFIDSGRLFLAGHSSAATLALQVAQNAPKIKGCVAYAPIVNVEEWLSAETLDMLKETGLGDLVRAQSPHLHGEKIGCPVFLFCAQDDDTVDHDSVRTYAEALKSAGKSVEYVEETTGGHYDGMIQVGIEKAIEWLKKLAAQK